MINRDEANIKGKHGETIARLYLKRHGFVPMQIDWIFQKAKGEYVLMEVKEKAERFEVPGFCGHGLDIRQIKVRLEFQFYTGIKTFLFIVDMVDGKLYGQYLDILDAQNKDNRISKKGNIKIFPLTNFKVIGNIKDYEE